MAIGTTWRSLDATGKWIMPGLIDGHCHLSFGFPQISGGPSTRGTTSPGFSALRAAHNAQQVLRTGVTSVAVPGGTWFNDVAIRDAIAVGLIEGPVLPAPGALSSPMAASRTTSHHGWAHRAYHRRAGQ